MKKAHMATRVLYMTACILMGAAAGLALAPASSGTSSSTVAGSTNTINNGGTVNISTAFFAIYVLLFCLLICCFETGLNAFSNILAINFGFLYGRVGRLVFLLFVGFMSFSLSPFGIAAMAYLYLVGCIHIGIMFYYPKFSGEITSRSFSLSPSLHISLSPSLYTLSLPPSLPLCTLSPSLPPSLSPSLPLCTLPPSLPPSLPPYLPLCTLPPSLSPSLPISLSVHSLSPYLPISLSVHSLPPSLPISLSVHSLPPSLPLSLVINC